MMATRIFLRTRWFTAPRAASSICLTSVSAVYFCSSASAQEYDYDLVVIGGGSGGLACAKRASDLGAKVALFDYVKPSPAGTQWKLGGTCVNVGCIPKKLMHQTALLGSSFHDAKKFGWNIEDHPKHSWEKMIETVDNYILSLNYGYRVQLAQKNVKYFNALASFKDAHTIAFEHKKKGPQTITAANVVIATGGRPWVPDIPGKEHAITSDDIFWKKENPGKTLCVGASYISLETAGFLHEFGNETHVMVRSILLRGFDRECADAIGQYMADTGLTFINKATPQKIEKLENGRLKVTYKQKLGDPNALIAKVKVVEEEYDTVMFATGRYADTAGLNLEAAGVVTAKNGKFDVQQETTNVPHIFAIGDVVNGKQELTPVAIHAGVLLSNRLFDNSKVQMDYDIVPTTVFTPLEYGACGLGEEEAKERYGEQNLEIYWKRFMALETSAVHRMKADNTEFENPHMAKIICHKLENERVVGFHYLGPNAGEVTQGYALAMKLGATKADFDTVIGIHPTTAENFTTLDVTKSSGKDANAGGC